MSRDYTCTRTRGYARRRGGSAVTAAYHAQDLDALTSVLLERERLALAALRKDDHA